MRWNGDHSIFLYEEGRQTRMYRIPSSFSVYTEMNMRNADTDGMGVGIGGEILLI